MSVIRLPCAAPGVNLHRLTLQGAPAKLLTVATSEPGVPQRQWLYDEHPAMFRNHPILFTLLCISIIGLIPIGVWSIVVRGERLAIGAKDILQERGLIAKQRVQVSLESVRSVRVTQSVMQRLLNVGDIEIFTAGDYAEIAIRGLPRPNDVREIVSAKADSLSGA